MGQRLLDDKNVKIFLGVLQVIGGRQRITIRKKEDFFNFLEKPSELVKTSGKYLSFVKISLITPDGSSYHILETSHEYESQENRKFNIPVIQHLQNYLRDTYKVHFGGMTKEMPEIVIMSYRDGDGKTYLDIYNISSDSKVKIEEIMDKASSRGDRYKVVVKQLEELTKEKEELEAGFALTDEI